MTVKVSDKGWIIETTNTCYDMLVQGGVSGRRELVTFEQLAAAGIVGDPDDDYNDYISNEEMARTLPSRVIRKGHIIQ